MTAGRIQEMPDDERPRERLLRSGPASLSNAELLAIFIRTGTPGRNAVQLGRELIEARDGLHGLARCSVADLRRMVKGIGTAKACELVAAFELGRRLALGPGRRISLQDPQAVYELMGPEMRNFPTEVVRVILLNTKYDMIGMETISQGTLNESIAHPREVFRPALVHSAFAIVLVHNHPSGDPSPSEADRHLTRRLVTAGDTVGIRLLDHVIIGQPSSDRPAYASFREMGLL